MSTPVFDPKAHLAARNAAEIERRTPPLIPVPPITKAIEVEKPPEPEVKPETGHMSRSQRRELNRLREQMAEERGRRLAIEEYIAKNMQTSPPKQEISDGEPKRDDFKTDAEYYKALGAYSARQEVAKSRNENTFQQQLQEEINEASASQEAYKEQIGEEEWKQLIEDTEDFQFPGGATEVERILFATSGARVLVGKWLVDHPKDFDRLIELRDSEIRQRKFFANLEGKAEIAYTQRSKKAAQAKEPDPEDRTHPAEAQAGRKPLPRPSSEAAAVGGSSVPPEPPIGSAAWIAKRNAMKAPTRF